MPRHNVCGEVVGCKAEKLVLESESSHEEFLIKRGHRDRSIEKFDSPDLRKCKGTSESTKRGRREKISKRSLKMPQVPEKIVDLVDILLHENFLNVVDQYFKPSMNNQLQAKSREKKSNTRKSPLKTAVSIRNNVSSSPKCNLSQTELQIPE
nr:uncharacterized protein LOC117222627 isoform X1 [Megalopta genalis]